MLALDVLPVPPSLEVAATELFFTPVVVPVTFTTIVPLPLAASAAPERLIEPAPATGPLSAKPLGLATTNPAGRLSVKPIPVSEIVFELVIVMVRVEFVFSV